MVSQTRIRNVKASGILLVSLGLFILFMWGLPPLWEANDLDRTLNCDTIIKCIEKPVKIIWKNSHGLPVYEIRGIVTLRANHTFVVDKFFEYEINMQTNRADVKEMIFLIDSSKNLKLLNTTDPNILLLNAKIDQRFINSTLTNNVFHANGIWSYGEPEDIGMFVIIADDKKFVEYAGYTQKLITIQTESQLDEVKNTFESKKTNKIILGLSWIGVALAPLLLGGDLIARVSLRED